MLGYIIPPIVIVLSLAALIFFLFRKSARISEELILEERKKEIESPRPNGRKLFRFTQMILQIMKLYLKHLLAKTLKKLPLKCSKKQMW